MGCFVKTQESTSTLGSLQPVPVSPAAIIASELGELVNLARHGGDLTKEFVDRLDRARKLAEGLDTYVSKCTTTESPTLASLASRTAKAEWASHFSAGETAVELEQEMLSGHVEGQLLQVLVRTAKAKRVLEIGMFTGYSALAMAEALPSDGLVVACELDPFAAEFAKKSFAASEDGRKIDVRVGPAGETLEELAVSGETFDFVFIDADKAGYITYYDMLLDRDLLALGGLICVDNTLMQGKPYLDDAPDRNGAAIAEFNQHVAADDRVQQVLIPLRDGVTLIRRVGE
jgi:caffeoyl-CoA O-methyltransferase